ncbi:MAG: glycosyltransferase family 1 protein [Candidatus Omnitrophica bacterium]|nr:glycosyltransferase family 1 protein [Candidatus Omnitrophota bacterium]
MISAGGYRIVRIAGLHYGEALRSFYEAHPDLQGQPYAEQKRALLEGSLVWGEAFSVAMRSLGHDAEEIIYDAEPLQKAWASEHGISVAASGWRTAVLLSQIEALKPDVLYLQDTYSLDPGIRRTLKQRFSFLKKLFIFKGYPRMGEDLRGADVIFSGSPAFVPMCQKTGIRTELLYHAFDAELWKRIPAAAAESVRYDLTFVGSSGFGYGLGHQARYWTLREMLKATPIELWLQERTDLWARGFRDMLVNRAAMRYRVWEAARGFLSLAGSPVLYWLLRQGGVPEPVKKTAQDVLRERESLRINREVYPDEPLFKKPRVPDMPIRRLHGERCHAPVFGLKMLDVLSRSRVTFNRHTDAAMGSSANARLFEATGVGTCLLTEKTSNLKDLFEEGRELVSYGSVEECAELAKYLLDHEKEHERIAQAGQKRTLRDHTVLNRCRVIDRVIRQSI